MQFQVKQCRKENIRVMIFKLGTSNVHQIKHKVTPVKMLPWQHSFPVPLCNEPNIVDFEQIRVCESRVDWLKFEDLSTRNQQDSATHNAFHLCISLPKVNMSTTKDDKINSVLNRLSKQKWLPWQQHRR